MHGFSGGRCGDCSEAFSPELFCFALSLPRCSSSSSDHLPPNGVVGGIGLSCICPCETPADVELGEIRATGPAWAGGATTFTVYISALKVLSCDLGSLYATCLPGIVGGMANSAPQLLFFFVWGGCEALGQGAAGHKEPLWPVNGAAPCRGWVGAKPLTSVRASVSVQCDPFLPPELRACSAGPTV